MSPSEGEGREFESRQARQLKKALAKNGRMLYKGKSNGVSPSGKATGFDPVIRWFESSHPSQNRQVARNSDFFFILQALNMVRVQCFSKSPFFSPTRTHISKNPYFTMLLSWDVKILSQRKADVFRLSLDEKKVVL